MKLEEHKYTKSDGTEAISYNVKKLNEYGLGLPVETKVEFVLSYTPTIRKIKFTKGGVEKEFDAVSILATTTTPFENVVYNEQYQNAQFSLPSNYAEWVKNCQKGDVVTVWLRTYKQKNEKGVEELRNTWDCMINGVGVRQLAKPTPNIPTPAPSIPTPATPQQTQSELPSSLEPFFTELVKTKEAFKQAFTDADILNGKKEPVLFNQWIENEAECGTGYIASIIQCNKDQGTQVDVAAEKRRLFQEIMRRIMLS